MRDSAKERGENEGNRGKMGNMGKREMKIDGEKIRRKQRERVYTRRRESVARQGGDKTGERMKV
jgi:hypothetical protein